MSKPSGTMISKDSDKPPPLLWELPDVLLCLIASFVAAPTHRATVLCHQIAPLCKASRRTLLEEEASSVTLWNTILREDYGVITNGDDCSDYSTRKRRNGSVQKRRACKRLRRSPVDRVRDAHVLIQDNTEIAFFYLSEMVNASRRELTKTKLCRLLDEYGPHLRINKVLSSGGLYLVEVCRARHAKESVLLKCVQELVEVRGALVDLTTNESAQSRQNALAVAAARAMPSIVKYLVERGACRNTRSTGRFRLYTQPRKTVRCTNATPLEFATAMRQAEKEAGATDRSLADLDKCIRLLN